MFEGFKEPINAATRYCAVFGHPVHHSASPAMHNAALSFLELNWRYLAFDVEPAQLGEALQGAARMRFLGLNLTVPHKLLAVDLVDVLAESARTWGAVNTVRFEGQAEDGLWQPLHQFGENFPAQVRSHGFNTDADAITQALQDDLGFACAGRSVLLLGAGGAGRVAALKLASEGVADLFLVNRTKSKAEQVQREIAQRYPGVRTVLGYPSGPIDLILNATSLGLRGTDPLPIDLERYPLRQADFVYDMIYRPAETPFLQQAWAAGCRVANGLGMLLYQGARALELWTGRPAPHELMREALRRNVYGGSGA